MTPTILHLGGSVHRLNKAIEAYNQHSGAYIIISSEGGTQQCVNKLKSAGIPDTNYIFDFNAWDTVTNFTKTFPLVKRRNTTHLFIATDKFHMRRAMAIAWAVYLFRGVKLIPCESLEGDLNRKESLYLVGMCLFAALLWRITGWVKHDTFTNHKRMPGIKAEKIVAQSIAPVTEGP
jgi:uncharacterized SAM-binding protein YcdF (DUF218 family)